MTRSFDELKIAIEQHYRSRFPDCNSPMQEWKGKEIQRFQQDLAAEARGQISEKSFYTYFKNNTTGKLPRIDVLNLLSVYLGYNSWADFCGEEEYIDNTKSIETPINTESVVEIPSINTIKNTTKPTKKWGMVLALATGVFLLLIVLIATTWKTEEADKRKDYTFCFIDADDKTPVRGKRIEVQWLKSGESPALLYADTATGCLHLKAHPNEKLVLAVAAPYYHRDTLRRSLPDEPQPEYIALRTDDYALMLHYISKSDLSDWEKRRSQLDNLLAEDLQAIQVHGQEEGGIAIYNKEEFIDKLTMPIETLKDIEVLETRYNGRGKAVYIRFK